MGASTSRKTVKLRRTPLQATMKRLAEFNEHAARVYAEHEPETAAAFRANARRARAVSEPGPRKRLRSS